MDDKQITSNKERFMGALIFCVLLVVAITTTMPYGFYMLLRIWGFLLSIVYIIAYNNNRNIRFYMWVVVAILYNPLLKIHFAREDWEVINMATIAFSTIAMAYEQNVISFKKIFEKIADWSMD